ncbi:MAG: 3-phosphoserine/phosphohydroxythreonine transaminase [Sphaerochaeta sp.]
MQRKKNFFAGPSVMPVEVLQELQAQILDYNGQGLSMIETSHRGGLFEDLHIQALSLVRELLGISDEYSVFFLGGGASLQFSMVPMNFLRPNTVADYIKSGSWAAKAATDAEKIGKVNYYYDGTDKNFTALPDPASVKASEDSSYLFLCSNETIGGVQWQSFPKIGTVPLIADMSSDILSRPLPIDDFSLIYAGVQKNLGPAGATLVIIKRSLLEQQNANLPSYLDYRNHVKGEGLYNTPPVFSIWAVKLVLEWIKRNGGAEGMQKRAQERSRLVYDVIDSSSFFRSPVDPTYRSHMNVVFRLPTEELEAAFLQRSKEEGMLGLKGHRSVGGLRASLYNSLPIEDAKALADLMREFERTHG